MAAVILGWDKMEEIELYSETEFAVRRVGYPQSLGSLSEILISLQFPWVEIKSR